MEKFKERGQEFFREVYIILESHYLEWRYCFLFKTFTMLTSLKLQTKYLVQ